MSIPSYDEFLTGSTTWRAEHQDIRYELVWWGRSDYQAQGMWNWYIFVSTEQFYPEDWKKLKLEPTDSEFAGSWRRHWNYENFPDLRQGEWTFGEMEEYLGRDGKLQHRVKVGVDYNHSHDRDGGYWQGKKEIEIDAKRSIEVLLRIFPRRRMKCAYSGRWDDPENFFVTNAGWLVHNCRREESVKMHINWQPKEQDS